MARVLQLKAVKAEVHIFDGEVNWAAPIRILLTFKDDLLLRLRGASDGQGLIVDALPLESPTDLDEYGRIDIVDFADRLGLAGGAQLSDPIAIRNPAGQLIGLALEEQGGEQHCIWINGDVFHCGSTDDLNSDYWPEGFAPVVGGQF